MFCAYCGQKLPENENINFCPYCGKQIIKTEVLKKESPIKEEEKDPLAPVFEIRISQNTKRVIILIVLLLISSFIYVSICRFSKNIVETFVLYYSSIFLFISSFCVSLPGLAIPLVISSIVFFM